MKRDILRDVPQPWWTSFKSRLFAQRGPEAGSTVGNSDVNVCVSLCVSFKSLTRLHKWRYLLLFVFLVTCVVQFISSTSFS